MNNNINRLSPIPIYYQIAVDIKNFLISHEYKINEKIPSESNLSEMYNVSRVTLRQALSELEKDGIITKIKGYGSILSGNPHPISHTLQLPGFSKTYVEDKNDEKNIIFSPKIMKITMVKSIPQINTALKLNSAASLCYIKRIFYYKNQAVGINNSWIHCKKVPDIVEKGLIDNRLSLTLSNRYNLNPIKISNTIKSAILTPTEMSDLNVKFTASSLVITSTSYLVNEMPLEFSKTIWLGDKIKFQTVSLKENS